MTDTIYEYNSSKEYLAKLIATENISITRSAQYPTASFDVTSRVMHMPIWRTSEEVYDLLTIHEMAHALYTPEAGWHTAIEKDPNLKSYLNIIEDARIERMIKRRFAGAANTFRDGYRRLMEDDFFGLKKNNIVIEKASLIDRINCYYKVGSLMHIPFNDNERGWLSQIESAETWEDVERIARALYEYCKEQSQTQSQTIENEMMMGQIGENDEAGSQDGETDTVEIEESDSEKSASTKEASVDGVSSLTDLEYRERMHDLENNAAQQKGNRDQFLTIGNVSLKDWVIPVKKTRSILSDAIEPIRGDAATFTSNMLASQTSVVNNMVKEFEAKKRATSFARNQYSKSGRLDMKKLAKYQLAEDIFRRNLIEHKGKNHSMVMIVDWSGSMAEQLVDTVVQTINLAMFCRKVGIPFSVQIFANAIPSFSTGRPARSFDDNPIYTVHNNVTLYEMLSSESNSNEFHNDVINFYTLAALLSKNSYSSDDKNFAWARLDKIRRNEGFQYMSLQGTPLNAALFITSEYVKHFRAKHKSEVTNVIILTDGDSGANRMIPYGTRHVHYFDPQTGVTYRSEQDVYRHAVWETHFMYDLIRDRNQGHVNIIGYFISSPREALRTVRSWSNDYSSKMKNGFFVLNKSKNFRADRFFIVSNRNIVIDDEWEFDENEYMFGDDEFNDPTVPSAPASTAKKVVKNRSAVVKDLKKSFQEHMSSKRDSRVVLAKFIENIAAKIV